MRFFFYRADPQHLCIYPEASQDITGICEHGPLSYDADY